MFVLMHPDLDITVFLSHFGAFLTSLLTFAQQCISRNIWCKLQILVDNLQKQVTCSKLIIHSSKASIYVNETASVIKMRSLDTILMNKIVNWLCHVSMTVFSQCFPMQKRSELSDTICKCSRQHYALFV